VYREKKSVVADLTLQQCVDCGEWFARASYSLRTICVVCYELRTEPSLKEALERLKTDKGKEVEDEQGKTLLGGEASDF
jgi:predicted  nucleic acid-binding Zn-ribbon protein